MNSDEKAIEILKAMYQYNESLFAKIGDTTISQVEPLTAEQAAFDFNTIVREITPGLDNY
ncbi:hypothetical protein [Convivina praedatoris]|nr:hypothetical protein [Convivina sp. LMG 32447]CAH1855681.1 hypothetical protein R077811_01093 [Convivina intestini]CAH1855774.1 hypothetical protein R078138_01208 [Convivina sp. LMG 32447]